MDNTIINKYSNGKIYKITNNINNECYIGSTITDLNKRMTEHIFSYKLWLIDNVKYGYYTSFNLFNNYGLEGCTIELIKLYPCFNKQELREQEAYYIKLLITVNIIIPGRTNQEYYINNKDKIKDKKAEYYINNKDKIKDERAVYYINNKDKIKDRTAEYYINNKDKILAKCKEYNLINKDKILEPKDKILEPKDKILEPKDNILEYKRLRYLKHKYLEHKILTYLEHKLLTATSASQQII